MQSPAFSAFRLPISRTVRLRNIERKRKTMARKPQPALLQPARPSHSVKLRKGRGDGATFEQIGVAWRRENGTVFCKLAGHQVIDGGFYLFPIIPREPAANGAGQ